MSPLRFQLSLRRRLRLPLLVADRTCGLHGPGCGLLLDTLGDHRAACPRTGLLARRAGPVERAWSRVAREGGARVVHEQLLRDANTAVLLPGDRRQLDLVAYGLTQNGVALCCDATVVSPLSRVGVPHGAAADDNGVALRTAEARKRRCYPELASSSSGQLVVLACEVGGRWNTDALRFVRRCTRLRAAEAPRLLRTSASQAWSNRWWGILSVAVQDALAATLSLEGQCALGGCTADINVPLGDVLLEADIGPPPSRLPMRG